MKHGEILPSSGANSSSAQLKVPVNSVVLGEKRQRTGALQDASRALQTQQYPPGLECASPLALWLRPPIVTGSFSHTQLKLRAARLRLSTINLNLNSFDAPVALNG